jgi:NTE family protein
MPELNQGKEPTAADFKAIAIPYLDAIKTFYEKKGSFEVSDIVLDVEENGQARKLQFVNLVQEGGGVLGVALVGYTYVLEELGIRFLKLAGTSAGAINTMLMAAINRKEDKKSEIILDILANKNLFDFVDGHWLARNLIKMFVRSRDSFKKLLRFIIGVGMTLVGLYLLNFYLLGRNPYDGFAQALMMITSMFFLLVIGIGFWIRHLFKRFDRNGYGMNPGRDFTNWISSILQDPKYGPKIFTLKDLKNHLLEVPNFYHREGRDISDLKVPKDGDEFITLISSDITSQIKVEFPKMWKLYWDDASKVNPADFVRASMSIPVFFEVFRINEIPIDKVRGEWERTLNMAPPAQPPSRAMFVDGGIISNFPINIFFNPNLEKPRLPTFGVMLEDVLFQPKEKFKSLGDFIFSIFNTVRFHYDKDFLVKHNDFEKTIGRIDVRDFNWLNFNIEGKEKLRLFKKGVEAATEFLIGTEEVLKIPGNALDPKFACREAFNWQEYRDGRPDVIRKLHKDSQGTKPAQQTLTPVV